MQPIYSLNGYTIIQCVNCLTSRVETLPEPNVLARFYDGFMFTANKGYQKKYQTLEVQSWLASLNLPSNARMLDIGGGGGFMCNTFQHFNMGEAFYIDLDTKACEFAKNQLGLKNVLNIDASVLKNYFPEKFDFIYSRHVIEHLIDPLSLISNAIDLLSDHGILVLFCPNGLSYEYLGHPLMIKPKAIKLRQSNQWSILKTFNILFSKKITHGLDPLRHLWAFTDKGLSSWLSKRSDVMFDSFTTNLTDKVYSPYFEPQNGFHKLWTQLINHTLVKINGGTHLVFHIRKKDI